MSHHTSESKAEKVKVLDTKRDGVHWGWWIFWLVIFWPMLAVLALVHYNSRMIYHVAVKYVDGSVEESVVDKVELSRLEMEAGGW